MNVHGKETGLLIISNNMKNSIIKTLNILLVASMSLLATNCWFSEPQKNFTEYISRNETGYEMSVYTAYFSPFQGGSLVSRNSILTDGGGQLDLDSIMFIVGTSIEETGDPNSLYELAGAFDTLVYVNPRHLSEEEFELIEDRSFFNLENWIPEGNDFVYSVYDSDFD